MSRCILAIDQGTSGTRTYLFSHDATVLASARREITPYYPQPGWVEQDPREIWNATLAAISDAFMNGRVSPEEVEAIGIANQAETTIFWNKQTGEPVGRAIGWQDRRSQPICDRLIAKNGMALRARTGMDAIPNTSATKIAWLMENDKAIARGLARGELLFGTVDTWLIWKLSGGAVHVTDRSNASATLLLNARTLAYDDWIINELAIPREILPRLCGSSEICAHTDPHVFWGVRTPIASIIADQTAAMFGQTSFQPGMAKVTYGTCSSLVLNTGHQYLPSIHGLAATILWAFNGDVTYGLFGWTDVSGAAINWLRDGLGIIKEPGEAEGLAAQVADSQGVYFVPIFGGLPFPDLNARARGTILGITYATTKHHVARAALEAMAYQTRDYFEIMKRESGFQIQSLRADGGAQSDLLLQFVADLIGIPVERPTIKQTTAIGAAFLAGLAVGFWHSLEEISGKWQLGRRFEPGMSVDHRESLYSGWKKALGHALEWSES